MDIYLVRHGKSAHDPQKWRTDAERPLSAKGTTRQHAVARGMVRQGIHYDHVWVSPFLRAQQTLEVIQQEFGTEIEPVIVEQLEVWGDPRVVKSRLDDLANQSPSINLLVVGHNPNLSDLVWHLTNQHLNLSTSDIVHIRSTSSGYDLVAYYPRDDLIKN